VKKEVSVYQENIFIGGFTMKRQVNFFKKVRASFITGIIVLLIFVNAHASVGEQTKFMATLSGV